MAWVTKDDWKGLPINGCNVKAFSKALVKM